MCFAVYVESRLRLGRPVEAGIEDVLPEGLVGEAHGQVAKIPAPAEVETGIEAVRRRQVQLRDVETLRLGLTFSLSMIPVGPA